ncbi:hypothetical protein METBIDRAFT_12073 [Metschnikowia bicuspidata var. bicuspidata NRRL YB-4993]|uniref:Uncharacterized protein n=1 Tax=Metschnikowia bicuspidata var. bicuspidata NRRL YB-4993 TaxID=869754 RepID=A0A1A0HC63_9ASCO|nr:hypothetical protein METBIDRAFT_12073 [Metschnikowia bicuspidata var. bicuspidata NRRL YB-4993]OBA21580.1 hypothetical protein METBIDRAFT_12073 [Metschnikowia bicuspidata var. bicuspidata NRRL YB-4993]
MSDSSQLFQKAHLARTGDLSFVGRFHHNFGAEHGLFDYLLDQKDMWGEKLFYVNERQFRQWVEQGRHRVREVPAMAALGLPPLQTQPLTAQQFQHTFGAAADIVLNTTKGGAAAQHRLAPGGCVPLNAAVDRNALAVHAGGHVTALKWLAFSSPALLAVAVVNSKDGLAGVVGAPELGVLAAAAAAPRGTARHVRSAVQLWAYDVDQAALRLVQVLDTLALGATARLAWRPARAADGCSGVLLGVFSDGRLHFFELRSTPGAEPRYAAVTRPSWTVELGAAVSAFDFVDHARVVVGTADGAVAEFVLPGPGVSETAARVPSFVARVADSMVTAVCVADAHASRVVLVNTASAQSYALQYDQMRQGRLEVGSTVSPLQPLYHRAYRIFVYPDSAESIGYTFARHPHQKHSLLLRTELVSAFHTSEFLNHPFAVVGNTCGDVYVMNVGRKIFGMPKAHNKLVVPLRIWSVFRAPGDLALTLAGDYVPVSPDRSEVMCTATPPEVVVSAAAWNENFDGSSTYAFATYAGLLVVERLDPVLI